MIAERKTTPARKSSAADDRFIGLPVGQFGLFATCLLAWALGLIAFCASCFLSILGLLAYNSLGHHSVDFADSYRYVALPVGSITMVVSFVVLLALWVRRKIRTA